MAWKYRRASLLTDSAFPSSLAHHTLFVTPQSILEVLSQIRRHVSFEAEQKKIRVTDLRHTHFNLRSMPAFLNAYLVVQSGPTLFDILDYSLPGSSVHGILQARILEWVVISSSSRSSKPRDWIHSSYVSCITGGFFTHWASGKALALVLTKY